MGSGGAGGFRRRLPADAEDRDRDHGRRVRRRAGALSAEDEAAVRAVDAAWAKAATAGDGKAIAALYADDATIHPPMEPEKHGAAAKQYWIDFTNGFSGPAELTPKTVEGRGDLAYAAGTYRMTLTPKKAGAKPLPVDEGKYIVVLKKQADGSWKIVHDIWNPNGPAPAQ